MILINERNEWLANKLVTADSDMMFAGVVAGNNPGQVWVDNEVDPRSAIVWSSGLGGFNFMGSASNVSFNPFLASFIDDEMIPFLQSKKIDSFEFSVDSDDWYPAIYQFIGGRKIEESYQFVYKSKLKEHETPCINLSARYHTVEIDKTFALELVHGDIKNADFLINYIELYWETIHNFLHMGYGYAALTANNEIASIAISSFVFGSTHAVGVETLEAHRNQGGVFVAGEIIAQPAS